MWESLDVTKSTPHYKGGIAVEQENPNQPEQEHYDPDIQRRGGAASFAAPYPYAGEAARIWADTIVRWNPVWVGFIVGMATYLLLNVLAVAIAISSAEAGAATEVSRDILATAGIWSAIAALIALFVGGYLAGRLGTHTAPRSWFMQGTVLWSLFLVVMLLLSALGFTGLLSGVAGALNIQVPTAAPGMAADQTVTTSALNDAARAAWWTFVALLITWGAAIAGSAVGQKTAHPEPVDQPR